LQLEGSSENVAAKLCLTIEHNEFIKSFKCVRVGANFLTKE